MTSVKGDYIKVVLATTTEALYWNNISQLNAYEQKKNPPDSFLLN